MAEMQIGGKPGEVYTETDQTQGKVPRLGTMYTETHATDGEKKYVLVKVTTGNLVNGTLVSIAANYAATSAAVALNGIAAANMLGVLVVSATASTSSIAWAQVAGVGSVLSSTSALPGVALGIGSTAGNVDDGVASSVSAIIEGLVLTATANTAASLTACLMSFPHLGGARTG